MKIIDIANRIDKSKENEDWVDISKLGEEFDLYLNHTDQDRLKSYWVGNWCCTDTWVGYKIYFLDDEAVAFSVQNARKSDESIHWFSKDLALKTKEYLLSLSSEEELNINICDTNEDIGDTYKIQFNSQILKRNKPMLNNEYVTIIERMRYKGDYGIDQELRVKLKNGEEKIVNVNDLDFKYYTN